MSTTSRHPRTSVPRPRAPARMVRATSAPVAGAGTGQSWVARAPETVARAAWRHRWRLAPAAVAGAAVAGAGTHPLLTATGLAATGAVLETAARTQVKIRGRMWLLTRERRIAAIGAGASAAWTVVAGLAPLGWRAETVLLAAALGWPTWAWTTARRPAKARLSPAAAALLDGWVHTVSGQAGPAQLRDSRPVLATVAEPAPGAVTFEVQLAGNVHGANALSAAVRRQVEVLLRLPVDVVTLAAVREDSTRIRVTLSPKRHLEADAVAWPGPVLTADGAIPIAEGPDGAVLSVRLWNNSGVEHGLISGTTGGGKSSTSAAAVLPGIAEGRRVVIWVDGKRGTSVPYMRAAFDRYAISPKQWMRAIALAHTVMLSRQIIRGKAGLSKWDTPNETYPILTLWIDEATAVNAATTSRHVRMIAEIAEHGRAVGVQLVQSSQSARADKIIGGVPVRDLMAGGGCVIAHRPGGSSASRLTLDSTNVKIDLKALPPEPGFAAILHKGAVLAPSARVRYASEEAVAAYVAGLGEIRHLDGTDLLGPAEALYTTGWDNDTDETPAPTSTEAGTSDEEAQADAELESRTWVRDALRKHGPMQLGQLEALSAPDNGPSRKTISNALLDLSTRGEVTKNGRVYTLTEPDTDEIDEADDDATGELA